MTTPIHRATAAILLLAPLAAGAQEPLPTEGTFVTVQPQALHVFETDIDSGGSWELTRYGVKAGVTRLGGPRDSLGVVLDLRRDDFGFEGPGGFGGLDPWDDVRTVGLSVPWRWGASERWDVLVAGTVAARAESGADLGDGVTAGLMAGAAYRVSETLSIGPGFGVASRLEDDASIFPFVLLDWRPTDDLRLVTRGPDRAVDGPQAVLTWQAGEAWSLGLGAGYERTRFRLDDQGIAPDGIGETEAWPVYLTASYATSRAFEVFGFAGYALGTTLTLEDSGGSELVSSDADAAPFVGAGVRLAW